jgi:CRP/FNR family transcriptional regulator, cyclic AMP receptor protein
MVTLVSFATCLQPVLATESTAITRRIAKRSSVYAPGSRDEKVYLVAAGQIKVIMHSHAGKECLLDVYTTGDFFGECCLSGVPRNETAIAMSDTVLKQVTGGRFLALLNEAGLMSDFVRYLAARLAEQRQTITNLATVDCEYRLAAVLLRLARKLGVGESNGLTQKISHQELSQMVGTTRPRVSEFMQRFRDRGLIEITTDSRILVHETRLRQYLEKRGLNQTLSAAAS